MIIYKVTNLINGKSYIGQTINSLHSRKLSHLSSAKRGDDLKFHRAIRKYGESNFIWEILEDTVDSRDRLNSLEIQYIKEYNTYGAGGYNSTSGGLIGEILKECRKKAGEKLQGRKKSKACPVEFTRTRESLLTESGAFSRGGGVVPAWMARGRRRRAAVRDFIFAGFPP